MGFGGGGTGAVAAQINEGAEQGSTPVVDDTDSGGSVLGRLELGNQITLPATSKAWKITAVEIKNGLAVGGNFIAGICLTDVEPPTSPNIQVIAYTPLTAQAGVSSVQKVNIVGNCIVTPSTKLTGFVVFDSAGSRFRFLTIGAANTEKLLFGVLSPPKPVDVIAWTAAAIRTYVKIYFKPWD